MSKLKSYAKNISILGSNGYIGLPLTVSMSESGYSVQAISRNLNSKNIKNIKPLIVDITKTNDWLSELSKSDVIIFLVAQTDLNLAEDRPDYSNSVTVEPLKSLLKNVKDKIIIYLSTVTIYDHNNKGIISEDCEDFPISQYDKQKKIAEDVLKDSISRGDNKGFILRLSNVYGYSPGEKENNRGILNKMIKRTFSDDDITVYGEGDYLRDYIYITDVVDAIKKSICNVDKLNGLTLILSSGESIEIRDAFGLVCDISKRITGSNSEVKYIPMPSGLHDINKRSVLYCNGKIKDLIDWTPKFTIEKGIEETINLYNGKQCQ